MRSKNIIFLGYILIIIGSVLYKINGKFYYLYGISILAFNVYMMLYNKLKLKLNSNIKIIFILLCVLVLYCILTIPFNMGQAMEIIKNVSIQFLFFLAVIQIASYVSFYKERNKMVKGFFISTSLLMIGSFILHYKNINYVNSILNFFSTSTRNRYAFGLGAVNDAGLIGTVVIILAIVLIKLLTSEKKEGILSIKAYVGWITYILLSGSISTLIIISSSSRNAILAIAIFIITYFFLSFNAKQEKRHKYIIKFAILGILGIVAIQALKAYYHADDIFELMKYSGRMVAFYNLDYVYQQDKILFGLGCTSKTFRIQSLLYEDVNFAVDSAYIYYIVQTGIVGFAIFFSIVIIMGIKLFQSKSTDIRYKYMMLSLYVAFLFTGLFETTILYAGMPIGLIFTVILLEYICSNSCKKEGEKIEIGTKEE